VNLQNRLWVLNLDGHKIKTEKDLGTTGFRNLMTTRAGNDLQYYPFYSTAKIHIGFCSCHD